MLTTLRHSSTFCALQISKITALISRILLISNSLICGYLDGNDWVIVFIDVNRNKKSRFAELFFPKNNTSTVVQIDNQ